MSPDSTPGAGNPDTRVQVTTPPVETRVQANPPPPTVEGPPETLWQRMLDRRTRPALRCSVAVVAACLGALLGFSLKGYPLMGRSDVGYSLVEWRMAQVLWPPYCIAMGERIARAEAAQKDVFVVGAIVVAKGTECRYLWYGYVWWCTVFGFLIGGLIGLRIYRRAWKAYSTAPTAEAPPARRRRLQYALICNFGLLLAFMGAVEGYFAVELKRAEYGARVDDCLFLCGEETQVNGEYIIADLPDRTKAVSWWFFYAAKSTATGVMGGAVLGMLLGYSIYLAVSAYGWIPVARLRKTAFLRDPEAIARMRALAEAAADPVVPPPS